MSEVQLLRLRVTFPTIGSLSSDVFERRTSTGSEPFSLVISLYATVFVLPSVLILKGTICPKFCSEARLKCAKSLFPVDVRRSKTSLLKLPIVSISFTRVKFTCVRTEKLCDSGNPPLGPVRTSHFRCAKSNANEQGQ